jgi:hypothetical protein
MEKSESELSVTFPHNKARIRLYGAENYDRIRGLYLDGVVIDESGDIDPRAWPEVIRPALSDRKGWATFIGTPKGRNAFYDMHKRAKESEDWFSDELRASQTGIIDAGELEDARRTMTAEQYAQEYECSFQAAIVGAYYGREMEAAEADGRVGVPAAPAAGPARRDHCVGLGATGRAAGPAGGLRCGVPALARRREVHGARA